MIRTSLIWHAERNPKLQQRIKEVIDDDENTIFVSHVSLWEIAIKKSIGKLDFDFPIENLEEILLENGFLILNLDFEHYESLLELPFFDTHKDPFDRMLIAQSIKERLILITDDAKFDLYKPQIQLIEQK